MMKEKIKEQIMSKIMMSLVRVTLARIVNQGRK